MTADGIPVGTYHLTFARWNPRILRATALINTQTGALTPVKVTSLGRDTITVRGARVEARRTVETARTGTEVWYSASGEWLAPRSTTRKAGHVLS